jgi:hypothetical protein
MMQLLLYGGSNLPVLLLLSLALVASGAFGAHDRIHDSPVHGNNHRVTQTAKRMNSVYYTDRM